MSQRVIIFFEILFLFAGLVVDSSSSAQETISRNHPASIPLSWAPAPDEQKIDLIAVLALRNTGQLAQLQSDLQNRHSPRYHQWLTTDEFVAQFGPTSKQMRTLSEWLVRQGFKVTAANRRTRRISFSGTAGTIRQALGTSIVTDGTNYANTSDPFIPAELAPTTQAILGLSRMAPLNIVEPRRSAAGRNPGTETGSSDQIVGGLGPHFGPSDLYTFYNETPVLKSGNFGTRKPDCIGLAELGNVLKGDLVKFTQRFKLPPLELKKIFVNGSNPGLSGDNEPALDVEWAHAVSPNTPIYFYLSNGNVSRTPYLDAITRAVDDNKCGVISSSVEDTCPDVATIEAYDSVVQQGVAQGQTFFKSSGDYGDNWYCGNPVPQPGPFFNTYDQTKCEDVENVGLGTGSQPSVDEEATSPFETSVGGTQFTPLYLSDLDASLVSDGLEVAWNDCGPDNRDCNGQTPYCPLKIASGGGRSVVFTKPQWQTGLNVPNDGWRDIPDVAMGADAYAPGFFIYGHGKGGPPPRVELTSDGGTSLATPLWAAISRLIAKAQGVTRLGNINARLYELGNLRSPFSGLQDVFDGNNDNNGIDGYRAGPGYDQVTGWGSPNIAVLVAAFPGAALRVKPANAKVARKATAVVSSFSVINTTPGPLKLDGIALDMTWPKLFSSLQLSVMAGGVTQELSSSPSKHNVLKFQSPLQIPTAGSARIVLTLTAENVSGSSSFSLARGSIAIGDDQGGIIEVTGLPSTLARVKVQ
jgi:subtilase family serine protease